MNLVTFFIFVLESAWHFGVFGFYTRRMTAIGYIKVLGSSLALVQPFLHCEAYIMKQIIYITLSLSN